MGEKGAKSENGKMLSVNLEKKQLFSVVAVICVKLG